MAILKNINHHVLDPDQVLTIAAKLVKIGEVLHLFIHTTLKRGLLISDSFSLCHAETVGLSIFKNSCEIRNLTPTLLQINVVVQFFATSFLRSVIFFLLYLYRLLFLGDLLDGFLGGFNFTFLRLLLLYW